jgi:hypothetical protein
MPEALTFEAKKEEFFKLLLKVLGQFTKPFGH